MIILCTLTTNNIFASHATLATLDWSTDQSAFQSFRPHQVAPIFGEDPHSEFPRINIDPDFLKTKLMEFSGASPILINGVQAIISERGSNAGRELARKYLALEYAKIGYITTTHSYSATGINFIAEKKGLDTSKVVIISSHIDSMHNSGADDNGTGTISALAIAHALAKSEIKYTLRIVGFDQEENGLVGSRNYVNTLQSFETILLDVNLEMTGFNNRRDGAFHVIDCDRADSKPFSAMLVTAITELALPLKRTSACTDRSDHASFWSKNIPAVVISQNFFGGDSNPCYHKACDKVDRIHFDYMTNITKAVASMVAVILWKR
ncbi:MAG: M28 family peptidase [Oligoflexia bacterium]|nr:M28 family peptidase [Oligoflexia bacterium]